MRIVLGRQPPYFTSQTTNLSIYPLSIRYHSQYFERTNLKDKITDMLVLLTLQHLRDFLLGLDPSSKLKYFNYFFLLCIFFLCIQLKLTPFCCTSQCRLTSYFVIRVILSEYCEEEAPNFYYVCETMKCLGTHISNVSPPAFSNRSK